MYTNTLRLISNSNSNLTTLNRRANVQYIYSHEGSITFTYDVPSVKMMGIWVTSIAVHAFTILTDGNIKTSSPTLAVSRDGNKYTLVADNEWYAETILITK